MLHRLPLLLIQFCQIQHHLIFNPNSAFYRKIAKNKNAGK